MFIYLQVTYTRTGFTGTPAIIHQLQLKQRVLGLNFVVSELGIVIYGAKPCEEYTDRNAKRSDVETSDNERLSSVGAVRSGSVRVS